MVYIAVYTTSERKVILMMTAKIFENGRSQAVRLPKEYRFSSDEVMVNKIGDIVLLLPMTNKWDSFMKAVDMFSDDFMADGRAADPVQEREKLSHQDHDGCPHSAMHIMLIHQLIDFFSVFRRKKSLLQKSHPLYSVSTLIL